MVNSNIDCIKPAIIDTIVAHKYIRTLLQPDDKESLHKQAQGAGVKNIMGPSEAINKIYLNFILPIILGINGRLKGPTN